MEQMHTTRVHGSANYKAQWIGQSTAVLLTASGVLPCKNFLAQLERRGSRISPSTWELVFYMPCEFENAPKSFESEAIVLNTSGDKNLVVIDAMGEHVVPIQAAVNTESENLPTDAYSPSFYVVYNRSGEAEKLGSQIFMMLEGTVVLPIFKKAFGPASKSDCEGFIEATSQMSTATLDGVSEDIPRSLLKDD